MQPVTALALLLSPAARMGTSHTRYGAGLLLGGHFFEVAMKDLSDEELCSRIRGYWLRVRGGEAAEVRVVEAQPHVRPDGRRFGTRAIVSNLVGGKPPGVRAVDIPTGRR